MEYGIRDIETGVTICITTEYAAAAFGTVVVELTAGDIDTTISGVKRSTGRC